MTERDDLPPGYKRTEVGVIPEDWEISDLGNCAEIIMGQSPPGSSYNRSGFGCPLINGPTEFTKIFPIKIQWTTKPVKFSKSGDLLICVRGSSTGRTNYADDKFSIGRGVAAIRAIGSNKQHYLNYQIISCVSNILTSATGSTFPSIDCSSLRKILIPLPSPPEQHTIAAALSDADGLIGALDALISKKRDMKQAAMQQLLTGRTRLPGFEGNNGYKETELGLIPEDWNVEKLGGIAPLQRGFDLPSTWVRVGPYPVVYSNGIINYHKDHMVRGPGVITGRSGTIGKVHFIQDDYWPHNTTLWVTSFCGNNPNFIFYLYDYIDLTRFVSGSGVPTLNRNDVHQYVIGYPSFKEQTAIATVLSEMDAEIAAIECRRDKVKEIKQGMMQQLLTGKVRLVSPEEMGEHNNNMVQA